VIAEAQEVLLSVRGLSHSFLTGRGSRKETGRILTALKDVSFDLTAGECLAIVGESGSGKTTLARCVLRLIQPTAGEVVFRGDDVLAMSSGELLAFRRKAQIVFQDPFGSLNPRFRAGAILEEVLAVHGRMGSAEERRKEVDRLLELVGLHVRHRDRFPHEFSGGQRQRLGIARALSVSPELLILDEPVSALDLSVQAQILNLLRDLQDSMSLTLILIAHDLAVVRHLADRVAVMRRGEIVELSLVEELFRAPSHPYTRGLLETVGSK
jgi:ABC-type oligopeptide transport system ATPase subunit